MLIGVAFLTAAAFVRGGSSTVGLVPAIAGTPLPELAGLAVQIGGGAVFTEPSESVTIRSPGGSLGARKSRIL